MTPEQFCYWLQGFNEINSTVPTEKQWSIIKDHLALVFNKVTPKYSPNEMFNLSEKANAFVKAGLWDKLTPTC